MYIEQHQIESGETKKIFNPEQTKIIKERTRELIEEIVHTNAGLVIFLDRSARSLSWMMREAWKKYAPEKMLPKIKFVNIGREKGDITNWQSGPEIPFLYFAESKEKLKEKETQYEQETKDFWSKLNSKEYIKKVRGDIKSLFSKKEPVKTILVDDYSVSDFTQNLALGFFQHNFPEMAVELHTFLKKQDEKYFTKAQWMGTYLPWNERENKQYTLLSDDENNAENVVAFPELNPEKRKAGILLKQEIKEIFKN